MAKASRIPWPDSIAEISGKARTGCTQTCPCPCLCFYLCGLGCGHFCILTLDSGRHLCLSQFFKETDTFRLFDSHHRGNGIKIGVLCAFSVFCLFLPIINILLLNASVKFFSLGQHFLDYNVSWELDSSSRKHLKYVKQHLTLQAAAQHLRRVIGNNVRDSQLV